MKIKFEKLNLEIEDIELFPGEDGNEDQWDIIFTDGPNLFNSVYLPKSGIFTFIKNIRSTCLPQKKIGNFYLLPVP